MNDVNNDKDEEVIKPDQGTLSREIQYIFQENQEISSENLNDKILDSISQEFTVKKEIGKSVKNTKLAGLINNFFIEKMMTKT